MFLSHNFNPGKNDKSLIACLLILIFLVLLAAHSNSQDHAMQRGCIVQYNTLAQKCFGRDSSTYIVKGAYWNRAPEYCTPCIQGEQYYIRIGEITYVDSTLLIHRCSIKRK